METIMSNVVKQCNCGSRAIGRNGNKKVINVIKKHFKKNNIPYTTENYEYKCFDVMEGMVLLDDIAYTVKTFAGIPPFFPYECQNNYVFSKKEKFCIWEREEIYVEKLIEWRNLVKRLYNSVNEKGKNAVILIVPNRKEKELLDVVLPISYQTPEIIAKINRVPILVIAEETWDEICHIKINKIEIKHNSCTINVISENVVAELGKGENEIWVCAHIDSAFEREDIEGANDNASGVAILMEVVRELSKIPITNYKVKGIFYNGEEYNMIGCINMLINSKEYFQYHTLYDTFYMWQNKSLKEYISLSVQEIIELDVVGKGKELNIYTNEDEKNFMDVLVQLNTNKFEKIAMHFGGGSIYYSTLQLFIDNRTCA